MLASTSIALSNYTTWFLWCGAVCWLPCKWSSKVCPFRTQDNFEAVGRPVRSVSSTWTRSRSSWLGLGKGNTTLLNSQALDNSWTPSNLLLALTWRRPELSQLKCCQTMKLSREKVQKLTWRAFDFFSKCMGSFDFFSKCIGFWELTELPIRYEKLRYINAALDAKKAPPIKCTGLLKLILT